MLVKTKMLKYEEDKLNELISNGMDEESAKELIQDGNALRPTEIEPGVYSSRSFNPHLYITTEYEDLDYGVADSVEQIKEYLEEQIQSDKKFIITVTEVHKSQQPKEGGWRWHKWGQYIGEQNTQHEYLYDEENIDSVLVWNLFRIF